MKDLESEWHTTFDQRHVRHAFVRKVLVIIMAQLLLALVIVFPFILHEPLRHFILSPANRWVPWVCFGLSYIVMMTLAFVDAVRAKCPWNMILLFVLTVSESIFAASTCSERYSKPMIMALVITIVCLTALLMFASQTKYDFEGILPYSMIGTIVIVSMSLVMVFWQSYIPMLALSSIVPLVFSMWLIIELQKMIGGRHTYQFEQEDYIEAAINISINITIIIYILELLGIILED